ncbi:GntP family permease [Mobilicoccus pelagius]|uniref:Putative gluconate permease n=1 Tax=Mobilicoccus pelagius NBRC 104925 TaxID=1089455 RepID=H5UMJ4_9MICO|nr:SLC13 family permease [Mobilicoccus pelagius]GAB46952.1 putative gluconate permease [Mobilicoccus pelagius NBRC 104925]
MIALHTTIAILAIVLLIIKGKVDPIIALVVGCLYLGLASGIGFEKTVDAITEGFGDIMAKIGLLIGFGVLIGSLLHVTGTFERLVGRLLDTVGPKRIPYALTVALSTIFPSIYVDVQVVLGAPVARSSAKHMDRHGLPLMAGALGTGIFCGYVFVVPGLAAVSIAGLLKIPLGEYLLYGIVLGPLTAVVTTWIFSRMLRHGWWRPETDEERTEALDDADANTPGAADGLAVGAHLPSLPVALLPILVPLVLIATGAFVKLAGVENEVVAFLGDANVAMFLGLLIAYVLARRTGGLDRTGEAFSDGLHTAGEILLVTGVGGSLGAVIKETGLADVLGGLFGADAGAPIVVSVLLAWFIAAVLHLAIGSVSVAAITAAGIIAPILGSIDVAPIAIGLAIAAGSLFALQVNSNFFWMFKALLGLSTQGSLKTMTTVTSIASFVSLPIVLALAFVL